MNEDDYVLKNVRLARKFLGKYLLLIVCFSMSMPSVAISNSIEGIKVYHRNIHLSPEHKQKLAADISNFHHADNLWDVLRENFALSHYEDHPAVREKIEWFMNNQIFVLQSASRAAPYLYYISTQMQKSHLPAELVLLPIIESGYNPFAISNMGASGIWQMMPGTATGLGIRQDAWYDGRRDIIASTRAALNHLIYLQNFFEGNWLLAIAAYNTGEGNVLSAIKRNIRDGKRTDFWSLHLAQQTKDYVPSLLALATIISHPDEYPLYLPPVRNAPYLAQIEVSNRINLNQAAALAGISFKRLIQLNAGFNRPNAKGPYKLILPIENVATFSENLSQSPFNRTIWVKYRARSGDSLLSLAKKFNTSVFSLRKKNHWVTKNKLRPGVLLLVPEHNDYVPPLHAYKEEKPYEVKPFSKALSPMAKMAIKKVFNSPTKQYILQPGDTVYMVRQGDSLRSIAKRFNTTSDALIIANQLTHHATQAGSHLIIPTHPIDHPAGHGILPGDTLYVVRRGDTVEKIARKFSTTPAEIRLANLIDHDYLFEGEKIVVPTHLRS